MVGESRTELLHWLNTELGLNYTKVEQCGTGAAYCQLMDSVVGGVPMNKVKFDTRLDYDHRQNLKILQATFYRLGITKPIEVERLIKCRLQDNLELLQFLHKFWLENKAVHGVYDAQSRRTSSGGSTRTTRNGVAHDAGRTSLLGSVVGAQGPRRSISSKLASRPASRTASGNTVRTTTANLPAAVRPQRRSTMEIDSLPVNPNRPSLEAECNTARKELAQANEELLEYRILLESLETERNFYFNKLIEIETLIRNVTASESTSDATPLTVTELAAQVQEVLYTTEEGFQIADEHEAIEEETF